MIDAWLLWWPSASLWQKHTQFGSDQGANLFQISNIDNINHLGLSVALVLLFPIEWWLVLITEASWDLTQFVNPRALLNASVLCSLLCRAQPDPLPGWEWWWGRGMRKGRQCQPALGPHAGMQEMDSKEEGVERLQSATGGTDWVHGW